MDKKILAAAAFALSSAFALPAFAQATPEQQKRQETGAAAGAVSGAATGAVGGALVGGPVGAAVGGVAGAAAGALAGSATGSLTPDDRVYVRERVITREVPSVRYEGEVVVGRELPGSVRYYEIEGRPSLDNYRYTRVNDRYVIVDRSNRIVEVIQ